MRVPRLVAFSIVVLSAPVVFAADISRNGHIEVPTKDEAKGICGKNPYINNNVLMLGCVQQEIEGAKNVIRMLSEEKEVASEAYWNCVENPFIDTYTLLHGCMTQEIKAYRELN